MKLNAPHDVRRAQQVLLEIARQSADRTFEGKTRLYKTFYFAHLYYAKENPGYLTEWPIVRMPHGPGINDFDLLIDGLIEAKLMVTEPVNEGPFPTTRFRAIGVMETEEPLSEQELQAIKMAVKFTENKTAAQLTALTHEYSHSWNDATDGEELSIYRDLLDEDEDKALKAQVEKNGRDIAAIFGN
jgi:hypothetical protein